VARQLSGDLLVGLSLCYLTEALCLTAKLADLAEDFISR
jgi:hypothetical protein